MKPIKVHKKIAVIIAIICIMIGTISYGANNTKKANTEKVKKDEGLSSLKVNELDLSPEFSTTVYEYVVDYIGEETKLTIEAVATEVYYDIKVIGNKDLKEGENLITILVTDQEEENIAVYQLTVNKKLVDEELVAKQEEEAKKQEMMVKGSIAGATGIFAFLIIMLLVKLFRRRKDKKGEDVCEENVHLNIEFETKEVYQETEFKDEELPKALRKSKKGKRYK